MHCQGSQPRTMSDIQQENQSQPNRADFWEGVERIARLLQIVVIPVVLAIGGWVLQSFLAERSQNLEILKMTLQKRDKDDPLAHLVEDNFLIENLPAKLRPAAQQMSSHYTPKALSPNRAMMAIGYVDGTVKILDTKTNNPILERKFHQDSVTALAFAPDAASLLTASLDKTAQVWDLHSRQETFRTPVQTDGLTGVQFDQDGRSFFTFSHGTVLYWSWSVDGYEDSEVGKM